MKANVEALRETNPAHPTLARYATIGRTLWQRNDPNSSDAIETGIDFVRELCSNLEIEPLRNFQFNQSHIRPTVALAQKASSMRFNPVVLSDMTLEGILKAAM